MPFEPVILFFLLGAAAGLLRSDLKIPGVLYESLSIFLLLAIGLKGGVELSRHPVAELLGQAAAVVAVAALIPLAAFPVLRRLGGLARADAASIAAHYGSVSVVTFAVAGAWLAGRNESAEGHLVVFLVLLEFPALVIGVLLARGGNAATPWRRVLHEVFAGKSILLLVGGLLIGWAAGADGIRPLDRMFFDLFKGMLAFFLLEMGLVAASRLGELRRAGAFLLAFAVAMPVAAGALGALTGTLLGLSVGGAALLATLYASASYIAAPAAMRIAVPEANPALSIGTALGITFPFNLLLGIPLYHSLARHLQGVPA
ncbi:sodium-dependent bicarbonate transport family permease [Azospira restricta]|uniref:Sodium-dependent bicarbonate transport family permease n=1 Tax=Azospira restricta TaxID=404405 RepID=A0A974Y400_9RHOO|nr:sodium-dependent bicarbonate transport family permease [Azospira restricta]QRJ64101.1 sodium-dependent bicarbonate transport family permease [Azospira restricta]